MIFALAAAVALSVADYFAWTATVDDPLWGTVIGVTFWILVLALFILVVLLFRNVVRGRTR